MHAHFSELQSIRLEIASAEQIVQRSVCHVNQPRLTGPTLDGLYDPRMGTIHDTQCQTCRQTVHACPGHFGHIVLEYPVLHPLYLRKPIVGILRAFCHVCYRILHAEPASPLFKALSMEDKFDVCAKTNVCPHCDEIIKKRKILLNKDEDDLVLVFGDERRILTVFEVEEWLGKLDTADLETLDIFFPLTRFVIRVLPVLPISARPPVLINGLVHDDDLTKQYADIIKQNVKIKKMTAGTEGTAGTEQWAEDPSAPAFLSDPLELEKLQQSMKFRVRSLFDNSKGKHKHLNGRAFKGIRERITGKTGQIRQNIQGKRVNQSARTVIGPDPMLHSDEMGVPHEIADILYYSETVSPHNLGKIEALLARGLVKYIIRDGKIRDVQTAQRFKIALDLRAGDEIRRVLMDGDKVLLNRQPTLHRYSMSGVKIRRLPGRTFRFNLANCKQFNADFDGDEMNIHVPVTYDAIAELDELASVRANLINVQNSMPTLSFCQETLLGMYLMTRFPQAITRANYMQWVMEAGLEGNFGTEGGNVGTEGGNVGTESSLSSSSLSSSSSLLCLVFPRDFHYESSFELDGTRVHLLIHRGRIESGFLCKKNIQSILKRICLLYSAERVLQFVDQLQFVAVVWLSHQGFSIGLEDCRGMEDSTWIKKKIDQECERLAEAESALADDKLLAESFVMDRLGQIKDACMKHSKDATDNLSSSRFLPTILSGAKGDFFNMCQITSLLGQQCISGQRVGRTITQGKRTLPHFECDMTGAAKYKAQGFVGESFYQGLSPHGFFFHTMSGRIGVIDTSMKTAESGYLHRKMIKIFEDVQISMDGTVRGPNGTILQLESGEDGFDPAWTAIEGKKMVALPVDLDGLAAKYGIGRKE